MKARFSKSANDSRRCLSVLEGNIIFSDMAFLHPDTLRVTRNSLFMVRKLFVSFFGAMNAAFSLFVKNPGKRDCDLHLCLIFHDQESQKTAGFSVRMHLLVLICIKMTEGACTMA